MKNRSSLLCIIALLLCLCCIGAAQAEGGAVLELSSSAATGYGGDEITVSLALTADSLGGLQTTLAWNEGYLTYVEGSAEFAETFTENAMTSMINDGTDGRITLVYGNTSGYTAEAEVVFTARFLLTENASGDTTFSLEGTKATDASADLASLSVETATATVTTQIFDAGSVNLSIATTDSSPRIGETFTVTLKVSSFTDTVGSMQGVLVYDPAVLKYVEDSAAFSEEASSAALTKLINTGTAGEVRFVYASMDGCSTGAFITLDFEVVGGVNGSYKLKVDELKATNTQTDHLALMNATCGNCWIYPEGEPDTVYLTTYMPSGRYCYCGDTITVMIRAEGIAFGGLQGVLNYNTEQYAYVDGSAAYTSAFKSDATITMINGATAGQIRLVYTNANGYEPDGSDVFTAQFVVKKSGSLDKITLSDLKASNAGAEVGAVPAVAQTEMRPYAWKGNYDMSGVTWDYTEPLYYDGTEKTVVLTGLPEVLTPVYSGNAATEPGAYTATVTFVYDEENYYQPSMSSLAWSIVRPPLEEIRLSTGKLVMSLEEPWNRGQIGVTLLPTGCEQPELSYVYDDAFLQADGDGWYTALTAGTTTLKVMTADGSIQATCEVEILEAVSGASLPGGVTALESEAFCGTTALKEVVLPASLTTIGSRAFADSGVLFIQIPASVVDIASDAFDGSDLQVIYAPAGSVAAEYAAEHGICCITY